MGLMCLRTLPTALSFLALYPLPPERLKSSPHQLLIPLPGSVVQVGMGGFQPLHCLPGILTSKFLMIPFPTHWKELSSRLPWNQQILLFSPVFFFNFSYILNKFPIIEANRCSLAGVLGSAWLQNHFAGAHTRSGRAACQGKDFL